MKFCYQNFSNAESMIEDVEKTNRYRDHNVEEKLSVAEFKLFQPALNAFSANQCF